MSANGKKYFACVPFDYTEDLSLDRGEIFELRDLPNDHLLVGLGYISEYLTNTYKNTKQCPNCSHMFIDEGCLLGHKKKQTCKSREQETTKAELAKLAGADPEKFQVEDLPAFAIDTTTEII